MADKNDIEVGDVIVIGDGWYKGREMVVEYVAERKYKPMISGKLLFGKESGERVNVLAEGCYKSNSVIRLRSKQTGMTAAVNMIARVIVNRPHHH